MNKRSFLLIFIFGIFLIGCGDSYNEPTEKELISALKFKLPGYMNTPPAKAGGFKLRLKAGHFA